MSDRLALTDLSQINELDYFCRFQLVQPARLEYNHGTCHMNTQRAVENSARFPLDIDSPQPGENLHPPQENAHHGTLVDRFAPNELSDRGRCFLIWFIEIKVEDEYGL